MCEMNDCPKRKEYSRKSRLIRGRVGDELSFLQKQRAAQRRIHRRARQRR